MSTNKRAGNAPQRAAGGRFLLASTVGSLPFALAFAYLGAVGKAESEPLFHLALSFFIPLLLWIPVAIAFGRQKQSP